MSKKQEIVIKRFKDKSSNFWVDGLHYALLESGEIMFCAGGIDNEERRQLLKDFIKRNKVVFAPREKTVEEKQYNQIIPFGQYKGTTVSELFLKDKKYLKWIKEKYNFKAGEEKLKEEVFEILK
jgi:uncharacterized protein (DUF3820 family)